MKKVIPGLNVQWPWSEMIVSGEKTVETRSYSLPEKYRGVELAVIETPGPRGKQEANIEKARIIGVVIFSDCIQYKTKTQWYGDQQKHCVPESDSQYGFNPDKEKWGWVVKSVKRLSAPKPPPTKRGIVFALKCEI